MRSRTTFIAGLAVGYVLGSRAGRERYDQMVAAAKRVMENPTAREAGGVMQAQAVKLYGHGKDAGSKLAERVRHRGDRDTSPADANHQHMTPNSF
ncbi:MAG TPA: hypothetical protein VKB69_08120 [Micromonosporaceae bacterium]|nr:hypothetical protein [Micromonosporaceae bacterium]